MADGSLAGMASRLLDLTTIILLAVAGWLLFDRPEPHTHPNPEPPTEIRGLAILDGQAERRLFDDPAEPGRLLLVYRSDCPACGAQQAGWRELSGLASAAGYEPLAVTGESLTQPVLAYARAVGTPAVRVAGPAELAAMAAPAVPTTILVAGTGEVLFHAVGVLSADRVHELRSLIQETSTILTSNGEGS